MSNRTVALLTLALVAFQIGVLVPAMLRELSEFIFRAHRRKIRQLFETYPPATAFPVSEIAKRTHIKEASVVDALYEMRTSGEVRDSAGLWSRTVQAK